VIVTGLAVPASIVAADPRSAAAEARENDGDSDTADSGVGGAGMSVWGSNPRRCDFGMTCAAINGRRDTCVNIQDYTSPDVQRETIAQLVVLASVAVDLLAMVVVQCYVCVCVCVCVCVAVAVVTALPTSIKGATSGASSFVAMSAIAPTEPSV
jgi:hypothetical protein